MHGLRWRWEYSREEDDKYYWGEMDEHMN